MVRGRQGHGRDLFERLLRQDIGILRTHPPHGAQSIPSPELCLFPLPSERASRIRDELLLLGRRRGHEGEEKGQSQRREGRGW